MSNPPTTLSVTLLSLHRLAEHILAAALYQQTGRIGLCASPGGIATPAFGPGSRVIAVDLDSLVVRSASGEHRQPVSTLRAAGEFVGITPGGPSSVYSLATPCEPDAPLTLEQSAMQVLASWYALGNSALDRLAEALADESPSEASLWPEHFDLAISAGGVNYDLSPGDDFSASPYAYVGPPDPPPSSTFWNAPFGAFRTIDAIASVDDAVAFLLEGKQRLAPAITMCVTPALRHPNVTLRTRARVTRLETDVTGHTVSRVGVDRDGMREEYSADIIVVAGGAINSAALLLASASDQHPHGLGNSSGLVGRNLMLHNNSSLIAFSKIPNPTKFQKTLGINDYYFGADDWDYPLGAMQMLGKSDAVLIGFDVPETDDPADLARHSLDFWLTTEDLPRSDNRVTVDADGNISLRYTPTNLQAHQRLRQKFIGLLDSIQCRDQVLENYSYRGGRLGIGGVAHQKGTVRFGTDPATSALDLNCKLHDLENVYVADSSFFVSSTAVNPTLTIIANALRVACHIADRFGAQSADAAIRPPLALAST